MKKVMFAIGLVLAVFCAGCQSINNEALANAAGLAIGAGYASQGSQLPPEQQKIAKQVVEVFGKIGQTVTAESIKDAPEAIDKALVENIKDEKQLAQARSIATTLLGLAGPYMAGQTAQDSALIFAAFCRGVSAGGGIKL